jgi:hypothetical protein
MEEFRAFSVVLSTLIPATQAAMRVLVPIDLGHYKNSLNFLNYRNSGDCSGNCLRGLEEAGVVALEEAGSVRVVI